MSCASCIPGGIFPRYSWSIKDCCTGQYLAAEATMTSAPPYMTDTESTMNFLKRASDRSPDGVQRHPGYTGLSVVKSSYQR